MPVAVGLYVGRSVMFAYLGQLPSSNLRMSDLGFILPLLALLSLAQTFRLSQADIGTASHYSPPYTPSACHGNDQSQFPRNDWFAAAGEGIWDNGASCGRKYLVRCISAAIPGTCVQGKTIEVIIVDSAQTAVSKPTRPGTTFVLSDTAYATIANPSSTSINLEFSQV